jgi:hypothetical protein
VLPFYSFAFVMLIASAILFYRVGEFEGGSGILWAFGSVLVSSVIWRLLHGGVVAVFAGQVALFLVITGYRVYRHRE